MEIGKFKAKCLEIMATVNRTQKPVTITKGGVPIAQLVPISKARAPLYGMTPDIEIEGDIISPIDIDWDACN